jgi:hypothetical protein
MNAQDFFASNFPRIADDDYKTIDTRTVDGLLYHVNLEGRIVDPCADQGSGIVNYLLQRGYDAHCVADAFSDFQADWIVTNTPYKRSKIDRIINRQIDRVYRGEAKGVAVLVRSIFDFAKTRRPMFTSPLYDGQINLCFRVFWFESRDMEPKHNYVWHLWTPHGSRQTRYYYAPFDPRYVVRRK